MPRLAAEPERARPAAALPALAKLFEKEVVLAHNASPLFRTRPYLVFGCLALAAAIVPTLGTDLPLNPAADAIALVGLLALARFFIALAGMDVGTAFGSLGARREMLVGFLAEPALLMVLFTASLIRIRPRSPPSWNARAPRVRDLPEHGLRRGGVHHGVAGRERPHPGGQPGDALGSP